MQGRTTYGGLTAALSLESALELVEDVPVRSAQIAFVGPVGGDIVISPTILRRGRNSVFVSVDVVGEQGVAARSIFTFGAKRESRLNFTRLEAPVVPGPETAPKFFLEGRPRPQFCKHYNVRLAAGERPVSNAAEADIALWLRHVDEAALYDATSLLAMADAAPPAAMSMFSEPAPLSTMTWMAEFLTDHATTENGWFLARHTAQTARDGYSSQSMRMWNMSGEPVMVGRQTVAVFI